MLAFMAARGTLTLPWAFAVIGATSALAVLVQAVQIGVVRIALGELLEIARHFWELGRWTMLANLATLITTVGYTWTLRLSHGLEATAAFAAMIVPLKLANPLLMGIGNLLVPAVARIASRHGARAQYGSSADTPCSVDWRSFRTMGCSSHFPAVCSVLCSGRTRHFSCRRFHCGSICSPCRWPSLKWYFSPGWTAWATRCANFLMRVVQAAASLLIAIPSIVFFGIPGLIAGEFISVTLGVMVQLHLLRRKLVIPDPESQIVRRITSCT